MSKSEWREEFEKQRTTPPTKVGTLLRTVDGSPTAIHINLPNGKKPLFYGILYLTTVVGQPVGWYTRSITDTSKEKLEGWKLILMTKSRTLLMRKFGVVNPVISVDALVIHHVSESGKSILVELTDDYKKFCQKKD